MARFMAGHVKRSPRVVDGVVHGHESGDQQQSWHEPAVSEEPDPGVATGAAADHAHYAAAAAQSEPARLRAHRAPAPPAPSSATAAATSTLNAVEHTHRRQSVSNIPSEVTYKGHRTIVA